MTPGHRIGGAIIALVIASCTLEPAFAAQPGRPNDWNEPDDIAAMLAQKEQDWGLPIGMGHVLAYGESRFSERAISPDGNDWGITQLNHNFLPDLVWRYFRNTDGTRRTGFDWRNPEHNATVGCAYLADLIRQFHGSVYLGIIAYNWGPGHLERMKKWEEIPKRTLRYADQELRLLDTWKEGW